MPLNSKFIYIALIGLTIWSCNDDLVLKNVNQDRGVVAYIRAEVDGNIDVVVKKSDLITQDTLSTPLEGIHVDLYRNGRLEEARRTDKDGEVHFAYNPEERDSLLVEITGDDIDQMWAEAIAPSKVSIAFFDTTTIRASQRGFRIVFNDDAKTTDFYLVNLHGYRWVYRFHPITGRKIDSTYVYEPIRMTSVNRLFFSDNNIVNNRQNFELLNDVIFNGESGFELHVDVSTFVLTEQADRSEIQKLEVTLRHITKEYYDFLTTLSLNRPVYGGPFSISSQVPSNINGGYGIFATYSTDTSTIDFQ